VRAAFECSNCEAKEGNTRFGTARRYAETTRRCTFGRTLTKTPSSLSRPLDAVNELQTPLAKQALLASAMRLKELDEARTQRAFLAEYTHS
jgi:hypothetical protein